MTDVQGSHPCQYKRLKSVQFIQKIQDLPHVLKLIDVFAMSAVEAVIEAAATDQAEWLVNLLVRPEFRHQRSHIGMIALDVAAAHGHCETIATVVRWRDAVGEVMGELMCKRLLSKTIVGGHVAAFNLLLSRYRETTALAEMLGKAVALEQQETVKTICEHENYGETLWWAGGHCHLEVMQCVLASNEAANRDLQEQRYSLEAASAAGHFEIVKLLNEKCGDPDGFALKKAAIRGHVEIAGYLYTKNGCDDNLFNEMLVQAAGHGFLEMVELFYDGEKLEANAFCRAIVRAVTNGHLEVLQFLQSKPDFCRHGDCFDAIFEKAAKENHLEVLKSLYQAEGYQVSLNTFETAFIAAAKRGDLEVVKFLNSKARVSLDVVVNAFMGAALECRDECLAVDDQVGVLKFLYATELISPKLIRCIFPRAASCSSVESVQFLYERGDIPPDDVQDAFDNAVYVNSADVLEFLYKTGFVGAKAVEEWLLSAAKHDDIDVLKCLINCGCISRELLQDAMSKCSYIRTRRLLSRTFKSLPPAPG